MVSFLKFIPIVCFAIAGLLLLFIIWLGLVTVWGSLFKSKAPNSGSPVVKKDESSTHQSSAPQIPKFTVKVTAGDKDGAYYTKIAGAKFNCTDDEVGGFLGYVRSEPDNPYDKNAIAVYRSDGKIMGHLSKDEIREFRRWSQKEDLPCVGFIKSDSETGLFGKVKIMDTDPEEAQLITVKYVKWLISTFGKKYIPVGFNVSTDKPLQTKAQWLDFLNDYIEEKEGDLYEEDVED